MTEYVEEIVPLRFERITRPDRPGIWAFAGWRVEAPDTQSVVRVTVTNPAEHQPGWWSFLMDLPGGAAVREQKNDGGPAFPVPSGSVVEWAEGMTLRDWFAGQALGNSAICHSCMDEKTAAAMSYKQADAMLKARGQ